MKKYLSIAIFGLVFTSGFALAQSKQWIHVRVDSDGDEKFNLNLPLSLVDTMLPMIEDKQLSGSPFGSHGVRWDDKQWTVEELRQLWDAVKSERGYDLASFGNKHSEMRLFLDDKYLRVESAEDSRDQVSARIPITVVDALLSGSTEKLNLTAAIEALKLLGNEELISVEADRGSVQVWIGDRR